MTFDLAELQAKELRRATWRDLLRVADDEAMPEEMAATMDDYLGKFLPPGPCIGCGAILTRDEVSAFLLGASFTWGLAHGEGHCRECGYPARAYHRDFGPVKFLAAVLQYHPAALVTRESVVA